MNTKAGVKKTWLPENCTGARRAVYKLWTEPVESKWPFFPLFRAFSPQYPQLQCYILKTNHDINCNQTFSSCFFLKNPHDITFFSPFHSELKVFIAETDADEDSNCEIKEDGVPFELSGFAFALQKNSSWNHQISRAIHKLNAHDTIPTIFLKWTTSRCKISQQTVLAHRMGLDEFGGFLFNTAMICCGCFILMLAEILVYRRITRTRRSFSPQQNGVVLNTVTLPETSSMTSILNN